MERPGAVEGQEVGDVDERRDRPQPDGKQPSLQPIGARAVLQPADGAPGEQRAGIGGFPREVEGDAGRVFETARDRLGGEGNERTYARRREIPGDAVNAETIAAVGRDGDVDHRIVEPEDGSRGGADRRVVGELDDAFVVLADADFAGRAQHAGALDAADDALLEVEPGPRDPDAGGGEDPLHAGPRIGRAANDLDPIGAGIDDADRQPVGVGMPRSLQDMADGERRERRRPVDHLFDLEPEIGERPGDAVYPGVGFEMGLQPAERELHRASPPVMLGTSPAAKP